MTHLPFFIDSITKKTNRMPLIGQAENMSTASHPRKTAKLSVMAMIMNQLIDGRGRGDVSVEM